MPRRGGDPGRASGDARPGLARGGPGMSPETLTPEELRQYARELRDRRTDAEGLRRDLARQGMDVRDLDALIARLREMEGAASSGDAEELRRLQAAVVDGFKAFEFALRRRIEGDSREPLLGNTDEVPPGFRKMVEEYYKSLARKDGGR
ncbi:MAG TPA: hypothetical protein VFS05_16745 [Gemmatimonadaceae bacterium]|nr:hypothetical protein [Gemmatimonadaceae bacterium]